MPIVEGKMIPCEGLATIRIPTDQRKYHQMHLVDFTADGHVSEAQWEEGADPSDQSVNVNRRHQSKILVITATCWH